MLSLYDKTFISILGLEYLNNGLKTMTSLATSELLLTKYGLESKEMQHRVALIALPWTIKLFYGIVIETLPIFISRNRSYIVLTGFLQFLTAIIIATKDFENVDIFMGLLIVMNLSAAVLDVVADGIMVMEAKKDPERGSEALQSFSWILLYFGGIIGGAGGGYMIDKVNPVYAFYVPAVLGLVIAMNGFLLN